MKGHVVVHAFERGRYLWTRETHNVTCRASKATIAHLLGGDTASQNPGAPITVIGFGSDASPPTLISPTLASDYFLTAPYYFKHVGTISYPIPGQVSFAWSLNGASDTGALGINVQEIGLWCNPTGVSMPGTTSPNTLFARALLGLGVITSGVSFSSYWLETA